MAMETYSSIRLVYFERDAILDDVSRPTVGLFAVFIEIVDYYDDFC